MTDISMDMARRLAVASQGYVNTSPLSDSLDETESVVKRLGFVQIDTIQVVQRAHHHIVWSRFPGYGPGMLETLHWPERRIFESFRGIARYLPMSDFRFHCPETLAGDSARGTWFNRECAWYKSNCKLCNSVLKRIQSEGPLGAADFSSPPRKQRGGGWWDWKPAKRALETLHSMGMLMVRERRSFKRFYDLPERVVPGDVDTSRPERSEIARYFLRGHLRCLGIATEGDLLARVGHADLMKSALNDLVADKTVVPVKVRGLDDDHYVATDHLKSAADSKEGRNRARILSPFDPLVLWTGGRGRLKRYFESEYRLGCYTRAPERRFGYFGLPILFDDMIIGFVDAKADRKPKRLFVLTTKVQKKPRNRTMLIRALGDALGQFSCFNACTEVVFEKVEPKWLKTPLQRRCNRLLGEAGKSDLQPAARRRGKPK